MLIYECSDAHLQPSDKLGDLLHFIDLAVSDNADMVIINGDFLDIIINGASQYYTQMIALDYYCEELDIVLHVVTGNHERGTRQLKTALKHCKYIKAVGSKFVIEGSNFPWTFVHGDQFSVDWGHFNWLYKGIATIGLNFFPGMWYRLCQKAGWLPSAEKPEKFEESQRYTEITGIIWTRAIKYAQKNKTNVCIGHTHTAMKIESCGYAVIDSGDIRDGSYVVIKDNEAEVRWLK